MPPWMPLGPFCEGENRVVDLAVVDGKPRLLRTVATLESEDDAHLLATAPRLLELLQQTVAQMPDDDDNRAELEGAIRSATLSHMGRAAREGRDA